MEYKKYCQKPLMLLLLLCTVSAKANELSQQIEKCRAITGDKERLVCFDHLNIPGTNEPITESSEASATSSVADQRATVQENRNADTRNADTATASLLSKHWELDAADKKGIFTFRPHYDNYFVATYNPSPNNTPYLPFRSFVGNEGGLSHSELAFQLGFKLKLLEKPLGAPMDLWLGYTQRSFWQAFNHQSSSPFRENNYQPELMAVMPLDIDLSALKLRFLNLGIMHQSNGQTSSLSRSWNRVYAQLGFERENFTLLTRVWKRINEPKDTDDNPNIVDYMGRGDVLAKYYRNGNEFSLLGRYNFSTSKGAAQLSWAFPIVSNLKGYIQYFTGYGYGLIDYNAYQRVLGLGFLVEFK